MMTVETMTAGDARPRRASTNELRGKRAAVLLFAHYPYDPRPRRSAEALASEGMDVEVFCLKASPAEPTRETFNGVRISRLPLKRRRGGRFGYLFQYSAFIAAAFLFLAMRSLRGRFALVHVHNMPDTLVFSALVPKLLGAKVILDLHDPMPELMMTIFRLDPSSFAVRVLRRLERWSTAFADLVLTVNLACKTIFSSRSCPADKIRVIMNSPDENIFGFEAPVAAAPGSERQPFVIMYHGSLVERNGLDVAVRALASVRLLVPRAELHIFGDATPFLEQVMDAVRANGLEDAVRCFGGKTQEEIRAAIDRCDVGIIPNRRTMFTEINTPTRIFEYLARGKPVITGSARGVQDYFNCDALFFFELGDAEDLARMIVHVFQCPLDAEVVVKRGQEVYLAHRWREERRELVAGAARLVAASTRSGRADAETRAG
jgi:glycosyltransferase involved in cell wall biosynthesis